MAPSALAYSMSLLAVPFAAWAALVAVATRAPDGYEDQVGFHFGVLAEECADAAAWFACEI